MNYEQKYKEALERAKDYIEKQNPPVSILYEIFPELKESVDEKIRKWLICGMNALKEQKNETFATIPIDDAIAWLEKQGESYTKKDVDDAYLKGICDAKHELEKQGEQKPILDFKASNFYVSKVDGKIHDMTYNPTDKVEPKFKVKYAGSEYNVLEVKDIAGVTFYGIEDEPNHIDYVQADNCEIISGYAIKENGSSYPTNPAVFSEQKPFDYENVNIQQKDFASVGETATIELSSPIDCGDRIYHVSHKPIEKNGEQKPAWSEEDENYLQSAENAFEYQNNKNSSTILWLKSLKNRVQHQIKKWSDEDERMYRMCVDAVEYYHTSEDESTIRNWLKSLKERITWKPSKEQIEALDDALNERGFDYNYLNSLYEQLKKL